VPTLVGSWWRWYTRQRRKGVGSLRHTVEHALVVISAKVNKLGSSID
jgi:hypothetical protein